MIETLATRAAHIDWDRELEKTDPTEARTLVSELLTRWLNE